MASWRDMAARVRSEQTPPVVEQPTPDPVKNVIADGLVALEGRRTPKGCSEAIWREIVIDARRLTHEGWAEKALALGWSMTDLFGIGPKDDWEFSGLAVWLSSRQLVLLDGAKAIATSDDTHSIFHRGGLGHGKQPTIEPVLLWYFRRG